MLDRKSKDFPNSFLDNAVKQIFTVLCLSMCLFTSATRAENSWLSIADPEVDLDLRVWANHGGNKVPRERLQTLNPDFDVLSSIWDGNAVKVFGARNEIVSFSIVVDNNGSEAVALDVLFDELSDPAGDFDLQTTETSTSALFDWNNRPIEVFSVGYLRVHGLSLISYPNDDETHVPENLRRPIPENFQPFAPAVGAGVWQDRPDHDLSYPDIAVPRELKATAGGTSAAANNSQMFWIDIYLPEDTPAGVLEGEITILVNGKAELLVPVEVEVLDFELPDERQSKTMVYIEPRDIKERYFTGIGLPLPSEENQAFRDTLNRHFLLAWRHGISLFDANEMLPDQFPDVEKPNEDWITRLSGDFYTPENGYAGPGANLPHDLYVVGSYGAWGFWWNLRQYNPRSEIYDDTADPLVLQSTLIEKTSLWETWFQENSPETKRFLYVDDEPGEATDFAQLVSSYVETSPLVPSELGTLVTADSVSHGDELDQASILASLISAGPTQLWEDTLASNPQRTQFMYNGRRPASGSFAIEDDGVALRELPWGQYKKGVERWFYWHSTYYNNIQGGAPSRELKEIAGGEGETYRIGTHTNVFKSAHTFGGHSRFDSVDGETGFNYGNGDGVLFYPGTDEVFPAESFGLNGPIASLRLKHWRRGIQDVQYIHLASQVAPAATQAIVDSTVPEALWEIGVADIQDPTYVNKPPSWPTDSEVWETARRDLANLILDADASASPQITTQPQNTSVVVGETVTLSVLATGTPTLSYQWSKDSEDIVGATGSSLTMTAIRQSDAGSYRVSVTNSAGAIQSDVALLRVDPAPEAPVFVTEPISQTAIEGTDLTLASEATGFPVPTYQWLKDGETIVGQSSPSLLLEDITELDAGSYLVMATNIAGASASATAIITVELLPKAPVFTNEPTSQVAISGTTITLTAEATGEPAPTYQWLKDGQILAEQTLSTLVLQTVQIADAGSYAVMATNPAGTATSAAATLSVEPELEAPTFTSEPISQEAIEGGTITLSGQAVGEPSPTYQWQKDGLNLAGQTASTLVLENVTASDVGSYTLTAVNSAGSTTSNDAVISLEPPQQVNVALIVGSTNPLRPPDIALRNRLESLGHTVELYRSTTAMPSTTDSNNLVVISGTVSANQLGNRFLTDTRPVMVSKSLLFDDFEFVDTASDLGSVRTTELSLVDDSIGIGAGLKGATVEAVIRKRSMNWGRPGGNAFTVATLAGDTSRSTIFSYEKGATLASGTLAAGKRLAWHDGGYSANVWSEAGEKLFDEAISWLVRESNAPLTVPQILQQPQSASAPAGTTVSFSVVVGGNPPPQLTWTFDGTPIPGETSTSLDIVVSETSSGAYQLIATNSEGTSTSLTANLSIEVDSEPPTLTGVQVISSDEIELEFSEPLTTSTAENPNNYVLSGGANALSAQLQSPSRVRLLLDGTAADTDYSITVSNLIDLAGNALSGATSITFTTQPESTSQATISLVVGNTSALRPPDNALRNKLAGLGHRVTLLQGNQATLSSTSGSKLIILSGTVSANQITNRFLEDSRPILVSESLLFDDFEFVSSTGSVGTSKTTELSLVDDSLGIGADLAGTNIAVTSRTRAMNWATPEGNALTVATLANDASRSTIFAYERGAQLATGNLASGKRLAWHEAGYSANVWSGEGEKLFEEAVAWLLAN